jgi:hypothetical protein
MPASIIGTAANLSIVQRALGAGASAAVAAPSY